MRLIDGDEFERRIKRYDTTDYVDKALYNFAHNEMIAMPTVCDIGQIRAEIDGIEINGQVDEYTMFIRTGEQVKQMALDIIDKYTKGEWRWI